MDDRKITIGNATYYVSRQFVGNRTIQDAIRESITLHTQKGDYRIMFPPALLNQRYQASRLNVEK